MVLSTKTSYSVPKSRSEWGMVHLRHLVMDYLTVTFHVCVIHALFACASVQAAQLPTTTSAPTGPLIEGIVVDDNGGGIKGAKVRIEKTESSPNDPPLAEGVAGDMGDIAIRLPHRVDEMVRARVSHSGFTEYTEDIDLSDETNVPFLSVTLHGKVSLSGAVKEAKTGKPIQNALVECMGGGRAAKTLTDTTGTYQLPNMMRGGVMLTCSAEGFGTEHRAVTVGTDRVVADVELHPQREVTLVIEDNLGKPAPQVNVEAIVHPGSFYILAVSDAHGHARLPGINLQAQLIQLRMNGDRYVRIQEFAKTIEMPDSTTQPDSPLPVVRRAGVRLAAKMTGRVLLAGKQEPIAGVRVVVGRELRPDMPVTWTDDDGHYELVSLDPGWSVVSFQHYDYATAIYEVRLNQDQTIVQNAELEAGEVIKGKVVDEKGRTVGQVIVAADSWKGYKTLGMRLLAGDDGEFFFPNAPRGEIEFSFFKPGYQSPITRTLTAGTMDYRIILSRLSTAQSAPASEGQATAGIKIGQSVPDLVMTTIDGKTIRLSTFRGKYVFLDFWASWCGPCMREVPNVKALRQTTKDRADFVLIGISFDRDQTAFNTTIKKHDMDWPQVFGPQSGGREAFTAFGGTGIPYTCLIGPDGKLLADELRGPSMVNEVQKNLP